MPDGGGKDNDTGLCEITGAETYNKYTPISVSEFSPSNFFLGKSFKILGGSLEMSGIHPR